MGVKVAIGFVRDISAETMTVTGEVFVKRAVGTGCVSGGVIGVEVTSIVVPVGTTSRAVGEQAIVQPNMLSASKAWRILHAAFVLMMFPHQHLERAISVSAIVVQEPICQGLFCSRWDIGLSSMEEYATGRASGPR
jgi:hypothetical protein